jgi:hypothetical protein
MDSNTTQPVATVRIKQVDDGVPLCTDSRNDLIIKLYRSCRKLAEMEVQLTKTVAQRNALLDMLKA